MDTTKLIEEVQSFISTCKSSGYPLFYCSLVEAFPGDSTTSFVMQVGADWIKNYDCYSAINLLSGFMWKSMTVEARSMIFSIKIYNEKSKAGLTKKEFILLQKTNDRAAA